MILRFLLVFCFLFVGNLMNGQDCPTGDLTFSSQAEIDDFLVSYPDCTEIGGSVLIEDWENSSITNLLGLQNITTIGGSIEIKFNENLINLSGLDNLTSISYGLSIYFNENLTTLSGLDNLFSIGSYLNISHNGDLTNLSGLDNLTFLDGSLSINDESSLVSISELAGLTAIGGRLDIENTNLVNLSGLDNIVTIGGYLSIEFNFDLISLSALSNLTTIDGVIIIANHSLTNLSGLDNLTSIDGNLIIEGNEDLNSLLGLGNLSSIDGRLEIKSNWNLNSLEDLNNLNTIGGNLKLRNNIDLNSIEGLNNLNTIGGDLEIQYNSLLTFCSIESICSHIENEGSTIISSNEIGCNSVEEVSFGCGTIGKISHPIFYDLNENGSFENGEPFHQNASVNINPGNITSYSNLTNGGFNYPNFGDYIVSYNELSAVNWELTSANLYDISLSQNNPQDTVYFGIKPTTIYSDAESSIATSNLRCNRYRILNIYGENRGTRFIDGTLWLEIDPNILNIEYIDTPDTIVPPNLYGWHFENLAPSHSVHKQVSLAIPGPPDFPLGDSLQFQSYLTYSDADDNYTSNTFEYSDIVECSYDPNDKLVNPVYPLNYALIGEPLVYTIRFQNTGNAEAYDVVIRDTLNSHLNPASFRVIASSHDAVLNTELAEEQYLSFNFIDINLPDSTSNFEGSQGFVMYSIQAYEDIIDWTEITNTASIYFDLNPPIVTNTTQNTMLHSFDADEDGSDIFVDCDDHNATVYPGAEEIVNNGIDEDCDGSDLTSSIQILGGARVNIFPNPTKDFIKIEMSENISYQVELLDVTGKTLLKGNNLSEINLSAYSAAVYFLEITDLDTKTKIIEKLIVTK